MLQEPWQIRLFGAVEARSGKLLIHRFRTRTAAELFIRLALVDRAHTRDELVELLWPDEDEETARTKLRIALSSLRKQLEPPGSKAGSVLEADRSSVRLLPSAVQVDTRQHDDLRRPRPNQDRVGIAQAAIALYKGPLAPGMNSDWIAEERDRLSLQHAELLRLGAHATQDPILAALFAEELLRLDPFDEDAALLSIRSQVETGSARQARRRYRDFRKRCLSELGCEPSDAFKNAIRAALTLPATQQPAPEPTVPTTEPTVRLPVELTSFWGRERELDLLAQGARLTTLTGLGGIGKTRLAIEAARSASTRLREIVFVPLANVSSAGQVLDSIAAAAKIDLNAGDNTLDRLREGLQAPCLLVLDNLEQMGRDVAGPIGALLSIPSVSILATSRRKVGIRGERLIEIATLPVPSSAASLSELSENPAAALFLDRCRANVPDFHLSESNRKQVEEIVKRLDGYPLGLELAASWTGRLSLPQISDRLQESVVKIRARRQGDYPDRHQALEAAFQGSYDLLSEPLRTSLKAAAIFRGSFVPDDLEALLPNHPIPPSDSLSLLAERSLLVARASPEGAIRYDLLVPIREFLQERIDPTDRQVWEERWLTHFASTIDALDKGGSHHSNAQVMDRIEASLPDMRAVLDTVIDQASKGDDPAIARAQMLCAKMMGFWGTHMGLNEGYSYIARALDLPPTAKPCPERAAALNSGGVAAYLLRDFDTARARLYEALEIRRLLEDTAGQAGCLANLGYIEQGIGEFERAVDFYRQGVAIGGLDTNRGLICLINLASTLVHLERFDDAEAAFDEADRVLSEREVPLLQSVVLNDRHLIAVARGNETQAREFLRQALEIRTTHGDRTGVINLMHRVIALPGDERKRLILALATPRLRRESGFPIQPSEEKAATQTLEELRTAVPQQEQPALEAAAEKLDCDAAARIAGELLQ